MSHTPIRISGACLFLTLALSFSTDVMAGAGGWTNNGPRGEVSALAIDPSSPATVYAGTANDGIFKSTDAGDTWVAASAGLTAPSPVTSFAIDPSTPSTLYAGTAWGTPSGLDGAVWKSTDSGFTWAATGLRSKAVVALAIDHSTPASLYAGTNDGIFKSADGGRTWVPANVGLPGSAVSSLVVDPGKPSILYAGTHGGGVFKSTNSGGTWTAAGSGLAGNGLDIYVLAIDPVNPTVLYAYTDEAVFKTNDSGATWTVTGLVFGPSPFGVWSAALAVGPGNPSVIYAGLDNKGVWQSADGGRTWSPFDTGLVNVESIALDPSGTTLYVGASQGVWRTTVAPAATFLLPASARAPGANGAFYTTNLIFANTGGARLTYTLKFLGHDEDGSSGTERTFDLEAGRSVSHFDVLGSVFGETANYGAIRITSSQPSLSVVSVTSTPAFGGTLGQVVPVFRASELIPAGSPRSILYVREGDGFRSNLVLSSNATIPTTVDVELVSPDGVSLAAKSYTVPPNGMTQVGHVVRDMGGSGSIAGARLVVSSSTEGAAFAALLFVIDDVTNGPAVIVAK